MSSLVPNTRTVNGKALSVNVTVTGADIPVDMAQGAQKINAALAGKADKSDFDPLLFAKYYPDGSVKSTTEFTTGIKYNTPNTTNRTITVKPFCNTGTAANDNSNLSGRVVIPPFVNVQGNPYISDDDDGTRYKVVGVSGGSSVDANANLTAIFAPSTVTTIGSYAFGACVSLAVASFPAVTSIESGVFSDCVALDTVSLPTVTTIGSYAFLYCDSLTTVSFPAAESIGNSAFLGCGLLTVISSFPVATSIGNSAFSSCASLHAVSFPAATSIGSGAFGYCSLTSASFPAATSIGDTAFSSCGSLTTVSLPAATSIGEWVFDGCHLLTTVDFGDTSRSSVPSLGSDAFTGVPTSCTFIIPDTQYDAWIAVSGWSDLVTDGYKFLRHSEWEYARRYELNAKADAADVMLSSIYSDAPVFSEWTYSGSGVHPPTSNYSIVESQMSDMVWSYTLYTGGQSQSELVRTGRQEVIDFEDLNITATRTRTDIIGYQLGSQSDKPLAPEAVTEELRNSKLDATTAAPAFSPLSSYQTNEYVTYGGNLYRFTSFHTSGAWTGLDTEAVSMTAPDATLDLMANGLLRVVAADGSVLWQESYNLATANTSALSTETVNKYDFAVNATDIVHLALPSPMAGKVSDLILDVSNPALSSTAADAPLAFSDSSTYQIGNTVFYDGQIWRCTTAVETEGAWTGTDNWEVANPGFELDGLNTSFCVVVGAGKDLAEMLTIEPGTMCRLSFTLTAFRIDSKPTWSVSRLNVEQGGVE